MKIFKIILISVVCVFVLAAVVGYVVLANINFNDYKQTVVQAVYNATGRKIEIGDIQVKPSFSPVIGLKNVEFANASWAKEPQMVTVNEIELGFAIIPLLHKNLVVDSFHISNAVVNLEESADGRANWEFTPVVEEKTAAKRSFELIRSANAAENSSSDLGSLLSSLVIKQVALDDVVVNYIDKKAKKQSYQIQSLLLDENSDRNMNFDFNVNNGQYKGKGVLGAFSLIESKQGYPVISDLTVEGINLTTDLKLYDVLGNIGFDGKIGAKNFIGAASGYNESAQISLKGDLNKIEAVIENLSVAGNVITGTVTAEPMASVPVVNAALSADRFDIAPFMSEKKTAWRFSLIKSAEAATLGSDAPLPYDLLKMVNAVVKANIAAVFNGQAVIAKNVVLNANVAGGVGKVSATAADVSGGKLAANASLNAQNESLSVKADLTQLNLPVLMTALNATSPTFNFTDGGNTDLYVNLSGNGSTSAALISGLNGQVVAIVDKSQLHIGNIGLLKGNIISQLLNTLSLTKGNDDLNLCCAVVRTDIEDGKASFPNGITVNADKFTIVANGDVNLKNEKISFSVKPFAGKLTDTNIAKALSSLVKLTGTIEDPKIGVDTTNAIKTIVGVTTAGPVYLGAQMLLENDGSTCYTALEGTGYENRFPKGENVVTETTGDVGKILDDSVDVVKSTTKGLLNILTGDGSKANEVK